MSSSSTLPVPPPRSLWFAPALVLTVALLVTMLLLASVSRSIRERDEAAFRAEVTRTTEAVRERIDTTVTLLRGAAGLFGASDQVRGSEFADYVKQLQLPQRYPGIRGIGFTERILPAELERRTAQVRAWGRHPGFRVWPEGPRDEYHAIVFLEPLDERNRAAIGYDMFTEPTRRAAMARARDEARPAASGKVLLVQEIDERNRAAIGYDMFTEPTRRAAMQRARHEGRPAAAREVAGVQELHARKRAGSLIHAPERRSSRL